MKKAKERAVCGIVGSVTRFIEAWAKGNLRDMQIFADLATREMQANINAERQTRKSPSRKTKGK